MTNKQIEPAGTGHSILSCFVCGTERTVPLGEFTPGAALDYPSAQAAYEDGWRPVAAVVGSFQGVLIFTCGSCHVAKPPTWCAIGEKRHELEPYEGPPRWFGKSSE